jgi:excisionase family DNA binding protein
MTETDLSAWLPIADAASKIGCSTRTIERLAAAKKLEQRLRPQAGSPHVAVYNPDDVARIASERHPAPPPFVLGAVTDPPNGNGRGGGGTAIKNISIPDKNYLAGEDLIRGLAVLISKALQSPPSPPLAATVAETLYVTVKEAAAILGLPQVDVRVLIHDGDLPHRRTRRGGIRIRRRDLEQL